MDGIIESLVTRINNPIECLVHEGKEPELPTPRPNLNETRTVSIGGFQFKVGRRKHLSRFTASVVYSSVYTHFIGVLDHLEINTIPILIAGIGYESMSLAGHKGFSNSKRNPQEKNYLKTKES